MQGTRGHRPHRDLSTWSSQLPSGIPPPTRPHTPPMPPPCPKSPRGWVALSKSLDTMAWSIQTLHTGVWCPNLSSHGWRPHAGVFVQNLLDMDGEFKSSSRAGRLAKSSLTWTCCAATPSRHHHVQQPAPLAHYATCPPTPSIMASHVPSPNHVTHLLPRECEATYPGGVTEGRVRAFTIELCLLRASQCSKWIPPVLV